MTLAWIARGDGRRREWMENYFGALALLTPALFLSCYHPYWKTLFTDTAIEVFIYVYFLYVVLLPVYYTTLPIGYETKSRLFWRALRNLPQRWPEPREKVAILAVIVKLFYLPLMLAWLLYHARDIFDHWSVLNFGDGMFPHLYWIAFNVIFLVDVGCFVIGYAIEHPRLGNEIRSVEPTAFGWIVCLACYPPFNQATQTMLGWYSREFPTYEVVWAQVVFGCLILGFLSIYAWASIALGWKASNLTHRGIVDRGPYRWVRHPAYVSKNLAWWVGAIPVLMEQWSMGSAAFVYAVLGILGWSGLYYLRAITEEHHLGRDAEYLAYSQRVRYRFIPGVW